MGYPRGDAVLVSWNAPQDYTEATGSIVRGWCFKSVRLGLAGESIGALSDAGRYLPNTQRDRMAGEIMRRTACNISDIWPRADATKPTTSSIS